MVKPSEISSLFSFVTRIMAHQKEIERLKGEQFNIFSVLRIERSENSTHSAFLAELLNPYGSHLKGAIFLKLFLQMVNCIEHLSVEEVKVYTEYHIGERNDNEKSGGRLDILIIDKNHKTISIENKIYAGDQFGQIERYCNYNKINNIVFFLTLDGKEPSIESKGDLQPGQDFHLLSYNKDIKNWLEQCLKETVDAPMLRESIKQYIILIRKMTSSPDNLHENEIIEIIMNNYEAASVVSGAIVKARQCIAERIRLSVIEKLRGNLPVGLTVAIGDRIDKKYAQIWVWHEIFPHAQLHFGIESFNGTGNCGGDLFIGVFNPSRISNSYTTEIGAVIPKHWHEEVFLEFEGTRINFGNHSLILNIQNLPGYKERLVDQIVTQIVDYIVTREKKLLDHLNAMNLVQKL